QGDAEHVVVPVPVRRQVLASASTRIHLDGRLAGPLHFAVRLCRLLRPTPRQQRSHHEPPGHRPKIISTGGESATWCSKPDSLEAVSRHLPEAVRPVALFAFITGWRVSEILGLTWRQVDFGASTVRLELGTTKNGERRTFHFTP